MNLRNELIAVFDASVSFEANWQTLCSLKQRGVSANEVQSALEAMFHETGDEKTQERIADLLDCVVGWCDRQYAVWRK